MKKLIFSVLAAILVNISFTACNDDDQNWNEYEQWRADNTAWVTQQSARLNPDGSLYYVPVQPDWYPKSGVLIHYFNDRELTKNNLQPMLTSKVTVKYHGRLYNDACFDSTGVGADSVRTFAVSGLIDGWKLALTDMRVGDTCEVIIPYVQGYGYNGSTSSSGSLTIPPYSALRFNIGLKEVAAYEVP